MPMAATRIRGSIEGSVAKELKPVDQSTYAGRMAARIRLLRTERGMTVDQFAKAVTRKGYKVGTSTMYAWENGNLQPNIDAMPAMAKALKIDLRDLFPEA